MSPEQHPTREANNEPAAVQTGPESPAARTPNQVAPAVRPPWWLQLHPDDFNALQVLVTALQLGDGHGRDRDRARARWAINLSLQLRAWFEGRPAVWGTHGWEEPCNRWSLEDDAIPLLTLAGWLCGAYYPPPMELSDPLAVREARAERPTSFHAVHLDPDGNICARLADLAFRMARHATQGRVGAPIIPAEDL